MKIVLDAMGGDNAPEAAVRGGIAAAKQFGEEIILVGKEDVVRGLLKAEGAEGLANLTVVNAPDTVEMHDDPATAVRRKPESSMAVALRMVKTGEADAIVSAGSTGALLSGATLVAGRIRGIRRGALAPLLPCAGGQVMLVDCGANAECTPEYLLQFAYLGALYMEKIEGVKNPRVGLVNNGAEDSKGDTLRLETYQLLKKAGDEGRINFVGNVEGSDVPLGKCDVAVTDGFSGNILLKTTEGVAKFMSKQIKGIFTASLKTKLGYLACKKGVDDLKELFNQDRVGGAPFLGIAHPVIKAHGSSNEIAFCSAIRQAINYTNSGMIDAVKENIEHMTLPRGNQK